MEALKIQRRICIEESISRIPALFAYLEYTEDGGSVIHRASDSPDGCYGRVIEAVRIPDGVGLSVRQQEEPFEETEIVKAADVLTYREMMNLYREYERMDNVVDDSFIKFVKRGIGEIDIIEYATEKGVIEEKDTPFGKCDNFSVNPLVTTTNADGWIKVPQKIYLSQVMDFIFFLKKIRAACRIAEATKANGEMDVEACCLCEDYEKYGGDTMYNLLIELSQEFVQRSEEYYSYACHGGGKYGICVPLFAHIKDIGVMDVYVDEVTEGTYRDGNIVTHTDYDLDGNRTDIKTLVINGDADISVSGCDKIIDLDPTENGLYDSDKNLLASVCQRRPEDIADIEGKNVSIKARGKSRLQSLRSGKSYVDASNQVIEPEDGSDWLWYYKIGQSHNVREVEYDGDGKYSSYHCDYISSIEYNTAYGVVRFTYYINSLYKKVNDKWTYDNTDAMKFVEEHKVYDKETWDMAYTTTTTAGADTDFNEMINGSDIGMLTTGDDDENTRCVYPDATFPFDTSSETERRDVPMGDSDVNYDYESADYELSVRHEPFEPFEDCYCEYSEYLTSPIFKRTDLMGVVFKPDVHDDVYIQRGDNAAFERHIRLSEIKTLDDLMDYSNGGYYAVEQLT